MQELSMEKCPEGFFPEGHPLQCPCFACKVIGERWIKESPVIADNGFVANPVTIKRMQREKKRSCSKWMMFPTGTLLHNYVKSCGENSTPDIIWAKEHLSSSEEVKRFSRIAWGILLRDVDPLFEYGIHNFVTHVCQDYRINGSRS